MKNPEITITMEDGGVIRAELYPEVAPNTVKNFISHIGRSQRAVFIVRIPVRQHKV